MGILYEKKEKICFIKLNRPEVLNAINLQTLKELHDALIEFRDDPNILIAIITGVGDKAFSAGADIKELLPLLENSLIESRKLPTTIMRGLEIWKPIIAAINGMALGGGLELALSCDIRIASEKAIFGQPEIKLGTFPGWGGTQRLPRAIPLAIAAKMLLTGESIDAGEAYRFGLVNSVVPFSEVIPTAERVALKMCRLSPIALRATKEAMLKGLNMSLEDGLFLERKLLDSLIKTEDVEEGRKAFIEKRQPIFKGK